MRTYVAAKLHGIAVTSSQVDYHGSVTIDLNLLRAAGIDPYEQVQVVNLATGGRWTTYVIPGGAHEFALNGGGARLGVVGDRCVVMTYHAADRFRGATVIMLDADNGVIGTVDYPMERV
jgi:aspartate 1-decarboxylase